MMLRSLIRTVTIDVGSECGSAVVRRCFVSNECEVIQRIENQQMVAMDKLLLTLTLVALSSGALGNVAQNLTERSPAADSELSVRCSHNLPDGYMNWTSDGALKLFHQPAVPWNQARQLCEADGGELAIINSGTEALMMLFLMNANHIQQTWLGIHDQFQRGNWVTLTGESLAAAGFDIWLPNKPSYPKGNEDCGALNLPPDSKSSGGLTNIGCNDVWLSYFCKIKLC